MRVDFWAGSNGYTESPAHTISHGFYIGRGLHLPNKPKRLCARCGAIVQGQCPCSKQRAKQADIARAHTNCRDLYNTTRWKAYSVAFRHANPLCVDCEARGLLVGADVVGHVKPASHFPELFFEPSNHRAICTACNSKQHHRDAKIYGRG